MVLQILITLLYEKHRLKLNQCNNKNMQSPSSEESLIIGGSFQGLAVIFNKKKCLMISF